MIEWRPFAKQELFLSLPDSVFEALYGGAAGGGKSDVLLMLPIARRFYEHSRFKGLLMRRTYPELEREIIVRSQYWYPLFGGKYNDEKKRWTFKSGAIMQFGHLEYEADLKKYDTAEYNYIAFDEASSFTETMLRYLPSRCRTSIKDLPAIVRYGTNPGGIAHQYLKSRFVDVAPYGTIIIDRLSGMRRIFIQSKLDDNPHIDPGYKSRLSLLTEADQRALRDGAWDCFEGQVFKDWRGYKIPGEPEEALHVRELPNIPAWWPRVLVIDWGYSAMTYVAWYAISPDRRVYIYREFHVKQTQISEWATTVANLSKGEEFADVVLCKSAWQNRGDGTIEEKFRQYSGLTARRADNDRILGKEMVQEYMRWRARPQLSAKEIGSYDNDTATKILRHRGLDAYNEYLTSFEPETIETNLPKLIIGPNCPVMLNAIPACIYEKNNIDGKPSEDIKEFSGDDPIDNLRYGIMACDRLLHLSETENRKRQTVANVVQDLQRTGDQTEYYRRMKILEGRKSKPVRRGAYARLAH